MVKHSFRATGLHATSRGGLGRISLARPLHWKLLTLAGIGAAVTAVLFICLATYTRRSTVSGQLVPVQGLITVRAPISGVVSWLDVQEGDRVSAGSALALLSMPHATAREASTHTALERRLQQRQNALIAAHQAALGHQQMQSDGLDAQLATVRRELQQIETETATRQQQSRIAGETLQRLRRLEHGQYISALQLKQQHAIVLNHTGQRQALQRQATALRRQLSQLQQEREQLPGRHRADEASHQQALAQLEQERIASAAAAEWLVNAPVDGVVTSQVLKPGQALQQGQVMMTLLPGEGRLEAELLVPSHAIGFIAPGDRVKLRYEAFPYQKFGYQKGRVSRISRSALSEDELAGNAQQGESLYRITVLLERQAVMAYGKPEPLRPGMRLAAEVMGEQRRLIEWMLEPLHALTGRMADGG